MRIHGIHGLQKDWKKLKKFLPTKKPAKLPHYIGKINELDVYLVSGPWVRGNLSPKFWAGGHDIVYDWIPKNEVWIDGRITPKNWPYILLHELTERDIMDQWGWAYDPSHRVATKTEDYISATHRLYDGMVRNPVGEAVFNMLVKRPLGPLSSVQTDLISYADKAQKVVRSYPEWHLFLNASDGGGILMGCNSQAKIQSDLGLNFFWLGEPVFGSVVFVKENAEGEITPFNAQEIAMVSEMAQNFANNPDPSIKLWVDDLRPSPAGWLWVKTAPEALRTLQTQIVEEISLDHDLGDDNLGTGYTIASYLEEQAYLGNLSPIVWHIHSANPVGRVRMTRALENADRYWNS